MFQCFLKLLLRHVISFNLQSNRVGWAEQKHHSHSMEEEAEAQKQEQARLGHVAGVCRLETDPAAALFLLYSGRASSQTPEEEAGDWVSARQKTGP